MRSACAVTMLSVVSMACVVTNPVEFQQEAPVSRPFIRDIVGITNPRLGEIRVLNQTVSTVDFNVPVDSQATDQTLEYQWFVDEVRDCIPQDGGTVSCEPTIPVLDAPATGAVERVILRTIRFDPSTARCHKVELWVSSRFLRSGDFHTPARAGDVDSATWWVVVQPPGTPTVNPATCQLNPTQSQP